MAAATAYAEELVRGVGDTSRALNQARASARPKAISAIRLIERQLVRALSGAELKGLPNLNPEGQAFPAVRLRGKHADEALPLNGRAVLVLDRMGMLAFAMRNSDDTLRPKVSVIQWAAIDADLFAEDLESVLTRVNEALRTHIDRASKARERYADISMLADRVAEVVGPTFPAPRS